MLSGFFDPFGLTRAFRLWAARRRYRHRPGPKQATALASLLAQSGDRPEALEILRKARLAFPEAPEPRRLHETLWSEAAGAEVAALEQAVATAPRVEDMVRLIELHRSLKNFDRCLTVIREAERRFRDSWPVKLAAGKALYHRFLNKRSPEDGAKAVEFLRQAIHLKPDCTRAFLYLAALLAERGRPADALRVADALLKLTPGDERARRLRTRLAGMRPAGEPPAGGAKKAGTGAGKGDLTQSLAGLLERLRENPAVFGALLFGAEGNLIGSHAVPNEHFAVEGHEAAVAVLAKAARTAADRIGIGRLRTCSIEGDPWRIYFGEVGGGTLAVLANRSLDAAGFDATVQRFSLEVVNR
jgi:tetratricopeptide (TPR) repeat protein